MDANDVIYVKGTNFNCFQTHTNFEKIYPKPAIVVQVLDAIKAMNSTKVSIVMEMGYWTIHAGMHLTSLHSKKIVG